MVHAQQPAISPVEIRPSAWAVYMCDGGGSGDAKGGTGEHHAVTGHGPLRLHMERNSLVRHSGRLDGDVRPVAVRVAHGQLARYGGSARGLGPEGAIHVLTLRAWVDVELIVNGDKATHDVGHVLGTAAVVVSVARNHLPDVSRPAVACRMDVQGVVRCRRSLR